MQTALQSVLPVPCHICVLEQAGGGGATSLSVTGKHSCHLGSTTEPDSPEIL